MDQIVDVNINGILYGIATVLPHMKVQKSGHIINVSSVAARKVSLGSTVYSAAKHAVDTELPSSVGDPDVSPGGQRLL